MPTSNLAVAPHVLALVEQVPHESVLDVGPGWGKFATLLREYLNTKPDRIDAVEAWGPYIHDHHLERLYDVVYHGTVVGPLWIGPASSVHRADEVLAAHDLVLMVDVIEHIDKPAALALLDRIPGRVVICTPVDWFHNGDGLPPTEEHVSHWAQADWDDIASRRPIEVCYTELGGWLVRLGPLPGSPGA